MRLLFCVLVSAFWSGGLMATPPQASGATPLYQQLVQQALQAEVDDQPCQRKALLAAALETDPEYAPARWHSGHVRLADGWATAEEAAARNRGDASLAEYRQLRNSSAPTAQAHLQLARYCRVHGLKDQEQMHWSYLLALAPNNPQALRALGLRKYKNQYLRAEQIEQFKATERLQQDLEKHWKRWCTQLRRDLASADSATRQAALAALHHLRHPEAIPWLDTEFADADDDAQLAIIAALGEMEEQIATLALVRRAVLPDSPDVREAAAQQLRRRPIYGYAPVLISSIAPPVELSYYVQALRDGVLAHYSFFYEGPEADYLLSISEVAGHSHRVFSRAKGIPIKFDGMTHRDRMRATQGALANLARLSAATEQARQQGERYNQRIFQALRIATGLEKDPTPSAWWDWWYEYNELSYHDRKPLVDHTDHRYGRGHLITYISCFMPGTIVWTETGPAPIESVQIGDRVLSQDVGTGELAYKLVLNTTIRPPSVIRRIRTGDSEVHATLGHPFWVVGEGWMMTKELAPGARLHALAGAVVVDAVESGPISRAHNLVVEDFNTYFVGGAKLLVHDNNLRLPTKALVPGLHGDLLR